MSRIPDPGSPLEAEGVPDLEGGLEAKRVTGDEQEGITPPSDVPIAVDAYGTTAAEERAGEPLALRLAHEEPDVLSRADEVADESEQADSPYPVDPDARAAGRLVEPDEGARPDTEKDVVARDVGADGGGLSAEELAMHTEPEA